MANSIAAMMKELMKNRGIRFRKRWVVVSLLVALVAGYTYRALTRPLPALRPAQSSVAFSTSTGQASLTWPASAQSAVGILGTDIVASSPAQKPVPTASTAKILTCLAILQKKPLGLNQSGPTISLTDADVAIYNNYVAHQGSVVPVSAGEQISEYQALQAILLPSANNLADSLAIWAFGSLPKYTAYANLYLKQHGLTNTHIGSDASGLSPDTTSTATDLTRLGMLAMQNPVVAQIVSQPNAPFPGVGTIKNVNALLGTNGIVGVKTGNSDQAGGAFIAASRQTLSGKPVTFVATVAGAADLPAAMKSSLPLVQSAAANIKPVTLMKADEVIGYYNVPWADRLPVYVGQNLVVTVWNGRTVPLMARLEALNPVNPSSTPGSLSVSNPSISQASVPLVIKHPIPKPSAGWRLTHPLL